MTSHESVREEREELSLIGTIVIKSLHVMPPSCQLNITGHHQALHGAEPPTSMLNTECKIGSQQQISKGTTVVSSLSTANDKTDHYAQL